MSEEKKQKTLDALFSGIITHGLDMRLIPSIENYLKGERKFAPFTIDLLKFFKPSSSGTEQKWSGYLGSAAIEDKFGPIIFVGYNWFSFKLPGGFYTPDYCYFLESGQWVIVEIKGSKRQANYRDARSKLRAAATLNPWHIFVEAMPKDGVFQLEIIKPDDYLLKNLRIALGDYDPTL